MAQYEYSEFFLEKFYSDLHRAYRDASRGKRGTKDQCIFATNELTNLGNLATSILEHRYHPSRGIAFVTRKPVIREIFAAPFRDRIVHHLLFNLVGEWWDRHFLYDSYSCRVGKGTLFGIRRLDHHIRVVSQHYKRETWVIKLDVQGYFMSLPRKALYERVCWGLDRQMGSRGLIGSPWDKLARYLWSEIIFDDPTKDVIRRGRPSDWDDLPRSKSLFCQPPGQGIVIGNLTSQLLSNIYLDQLDRFVTYDLGYKHYGRYVDDFYVVVAAEQLERAKRDILVISEYLMGLGLVLHPRKVFVQNVKRGIPFLGVVVYPGRIVPARRITHNFHQSVWMYSQGFCDDETIISYMGLLKHLDGTALSRRVFDSVGWDYQP